MSTPFSIVKAKIEHTNFHPRLGPDQTIPIHLIVRMGFSDFENDGQFNETNEEVVTPGNPPGKCPNNIRETDTYWNSSGNSYDTSPP